MQRLRCQHENRPQSTSCEECAAPLAPTCFDCGSRLSPSGEFCSECPHPVASPAAAQCRLESPGERIEVFESQHWPTVLHVTHQKAGSQWLRRILYDCAPERVVFAEYGMLQFLQRPVRSGMIYPTLYVTKEEFDGVTLPPNARRFVVIRDLRDTLASWYFSLKVSHVDNHPVVAEMRAKLNALTLDEGFSWFIEHPYFQKAAAVQQSWLRSGKDLVRYEDLLDRDEEILERILLQECGMPVKRARLREVIRANRFERLTGRTRGTEDISSHERKGIAGDWRNHFTDRIKQLFKERFGALLIESGYERAGDW